MNFNMRQAKNSEKWNNFDVMRLGYRARPHVLKSSNHHQNQIFCLRKTSMPRIFFARKENPFKISSPISTKSGQIALLYFKGSSTKYGLVFLFAKISAEPGLQTKIQEFTSKKYCAPSKQKIMTLKVKDPYCNLWSKNRLEGLEN